MKFKTKDGRYAGQKASKVKVISIATGDVVREERAYNWNELRLARRTAMQGETAQQITQRRIDLAKRRVVPGGVDPSQLDGKLDHQRVIDYGGCPACHAPRGKPCRSHRGYDLPLDRLHQPRWSRARKAQSLRRTSKRNES